MAGLRIHVPKALKDFTVTAPRWLTFVAGVTAVSSSQLEDPIIRPYPRELEEIVTASDGEQLLLRPVRPEDDEAFRVNFAKFSPEAVRRRFLAPMKSLTQAAAVKLTHLDYEGEMAFVLTDPVPPERGPPEGYGVARIVTDPEGRSAEFALIVRDDMIGKGLGTLLTQRLIAYARERGVREIVGDVLPENAPMLALCRSLGFTVEPHHLGTDPVRVRLRLDHPRGAGSPLGRDPRDW